MAATIINNTPLPNMNNELIPVHSFVALNHIKDLTALVNIAPDFMVTLYNTLINRHNTFCPTVFTHIPAPVNSDITRQVIGLNGHYFKLTTTTTGIDFIWHDRENNIFLFWGQNNYRVTRALNAIRRRIQNVTERYEKNSAAAVQDEEDDTDYSDMPPLVSCDFL
jgi:hypothetical protein